MQRNIGKNAVALGAVVVLVWSCAVFTRADQARPPAGASINWPGYGGGPQQIRYSTLKQIDKTNVSSLQVAWTYDTGEPGAMQTQPVVLDGVLYGYTPTHKAFAVKADTGAPLWTFDSGIRGTGPD